MTTATFRLPTPQVGDLSMPLLRHSYKFCHLFLHKLNTNFQKQILFKIIFQLAAARKPNASDAQISAFTFIASLHYVTALKSTQNDKSAEKVLSMTVIQDIIHLQSRLEILNLHSCSITLQIYKTYPNTMIEIPEIHYTETNWYNNITEK